MPPQAEARIALVLGEPFGSFGTMLPVGHASVYLDKVCAATPTSFRLCSAGEDGVVLSRYHDLRPANLDWLATPARTFFYGTENPNLVPLFMTAEHERSLRSEYRAQRLATIVPTRGQGKESGGDWAESIGAAFDRRLFLYSIVTSPAQDAAIVALLNADSNQRRYTLGRANCADFAADLLDLALPLPLERSWSDFAMTTPKNLARQIEAAGAHHPELQLAVFVIPQIPGTLRRSRPVRGAAETFLVTRRYLATLLVLQPELVLADAALYMVGGRWRPGYGATQVPRGKLPAATDTLYSPDSTASRTASDDTGLRAK